MSRLILPPRYDAEDAARIVWQPRMRNLYGMLRPRPVKLAPNGLPASLELVWMPVYAFQMTMSRGGKKGTIWVSVDASFGGFALFERLDALEDGDPQGEVFDPAIEIHDAEQLARNGLVRFLLRRRGAKPNAVKLEGHSFYHTPVWVYYFHRFGKKIDLAVLDGYTGDKMGSRMRIAILDAFIRQRQERMAQADGKISEE